LRAYASLGLTLTTICATLILGVHCQADGSTGSGFTEADFYCQEAAMRLGQCCPAYDMGGLTCNASSLTTESSSSSCLVGPTRTTTVYPTLTQAESLCILNESCATLEATKVCARATMEVDRGPRSTTVPPIDDSAVAEGGDAQADADTDAGSENDADAGPVCP
jgi:hypothetical protein